LLSFSAEARVTRKWLEELDIRPPDPDKPLQELSGGNRQKVTLAKVLEQEPEVLVMNDPTSGVDVGARRAIYDLIEARALSGTAVVVCSSDNEDLATICDRVICLCDGAIRAELVGDEISEQSILNSIVATTTISDTRSR
jgi:ribose transport system ATP-binding protein